VFSSVSGVILPSEVYRKYILLPLKQILLDFDALHHVAIVIRRRTTVRLSLIGGGVDGCLPNKERPVHQNWIVN
jgi:hypothetical protein